MHAGAVAAAALGFVGVFSALSAGCAAPQEREAFARRPLDRINHEFLKDRDVVFAHLHGQDATLCVVNASNGNHWFCLGSGQFTNLALGSDLSAMGEVHDLAPSPDGTRLAVLSVGEGHPILEVIDLSRLLADDDRKYKVLHKINPYPGTVEIRRWSGDKLIVASGMLLTRLGTGAYGRVAACLEFQETQAFALASDTGKITPLTPDAKDPAAYFCKQLHGEFYAEAIVPVVMLRASEAIPRLRQLLAREKDDEIRAELAEAIDQLSRASASAPGARTPAGG